MKKEKKIFDAIISNARPEMQAMLSSVLKYCSELPLPGQEKVLEKILFAFSVVDRKFFVEEQAYADTALSIGKGQTISQPSTVAAMLLYAHIQPQDEILEVGSGSGWNAALLAFLAYPGKVTSLERYYALSSQARKNVELLRKHLNKENPQEGEKMKPGFFAEDILKKSKSWEKKYNKILFTAGILPEMRKRIEHVAQELLLQDGILLCPQVSGPMLIFKKQGNLILSETKEAYTFVPLKEGVEE